MDVSCTSSYYRHHLNTKSLLLTTPRIIDLPLRVVVGQLSQSLEITYYATFSLTISMKTRLNSCWGVPLQHDWR